MGSHGFFVVLVLFLFTFNISHATKSQAISKELTMKLIPKYSRDSPMNPGNLTDIQRYVKMLGLSRKRSFRLALQSNYGNTTNPNEIIAPLVGEAMDSAYFVTLNFGSPPQMFNLELDSGSSQFWVQCSGCVRCFEISGGVSFEYFKSDTYEYVSCDDSLCVPTTCNTGKCEYKAEYGDRSWSLGILSRDIFTNFGKLVFGCGLDNVLNWGTNTGPHNVLAGIVGMGRGPRSLLMQLGDQAKGKFSHCLKHWKADGASLLRFGDQAEIFPPNADIKTTPLLDVPNSYNYYVNLLDISVNGVRLQIPPDTFQLTHDFKGGMIVDTGTSATQIYEPAYELLESRLEQIFQASGLQPFDARGAQTRWTGLDFSYILPNGFNAFPTITFHFEEADFTLDREAAFLTLDDPRIFCVQIYPPDVDDEGPLSIFGAFSLTNHYILHDARAWKLSFATADCIVD